MNTFGFSPEQIAVIAASCERAPDEALLGRFHAAAIRDAETRHAQRLADFPRRVRDHEEAMAAHGQAVADRTKEQARRDLQHQRALAAAEDPSHVAPLRDLPLPRAPLPPVEPVPETESEARAALIANLQQGLQEG